MIDKDIVALLKADTTLDTLLGSGTEEKIYPNRAPQNTVIPFISYMSMVGVTDDNLDEDRFQFTIVAGTKQKAMDIRDRLKTLLDIDNAIQDNISSTNYWIYYSKLTASDSLIDPDTDRYIEIMFFNIKYRKKF
ncbi:hypothetical protein C0389_06830 [bacterium]|nr:hypothetical protein [bacterium]